MSLFRKKFSLCSFINSFLGPLTYTENGKTTLYGVVSSGKIHHIDEKFITLFPESIYMRVATPDVLDWIEQFKEREKIEE